MSDSQIIAYEKKLNEFTVHQILTQDLGMGKMLNTKVAPKKQLSNKLLAEKSISVVF